MSTGRKKVSLKLNEVEISKALNSIEKQGTYRFLYNSRLSSISRRISIGRQQFRDQRCDGPTAVRHDFNVQNAGKQPDRRSGDRPAPTGYQDHRKITGESGEAFANVSVIVKRVRPRTTTDYFRDITLLVPTERHIGRFLYRYYLPRKLRVGDQSVVDVKLVRPPCRWTRSW